MLVAVKEARPRAIQVTNREKGAHLPGGHLSAVFAQAVRRHPRGRRHAPRTKGGRKNRPPSLDYHQLQELDLAKNGHYLVVQILLL